MSFNPQSLLRAVKDHAHWLTSWPVFLLFFTGLCIWCWVDVRLRGYPYLDQKEEHKTDLTVYTEAGAAFFDGREPYRVSNIRGWTYLYPPLLAMLLAPLHALQSHDQVTVWFFISVLFLWGIYRELGRIVDCLCAEDGQAAAIWKHWHPWVGVAAYCAAFLPTLNCLQRGQVGVLLLYFMLLGLRLILAAPLAFATPGRRHLFQRLLGGIVLALPIAIKVVPILPAGFLLFVLAAAWFRRSRRDNNSAANGDSPIFASQKSGQSPSYSSRAARDFLPVAPGLALGGFLFFLGIPAALVGWNANLRHLQTWSSSVLIFAEDGGVQENSGNSQSQRNQSLQNAVCRLGNFVYHCCAGKPDDRLVENYTRPEMPMDAQAVEGLLFGVRLAILAALLLTGVRLARQGDGLSLAAAISLGCVAMLVVSPVSRGHYFLFFVPGIFFVPWWLHRYSGYPKAWIFAAAPILMIDLHYFVLPISGRIGLLGFGTLAWLVGAMVLIARTADASGVPSLLQMTPARMTPMRKMAA
jgi:hypothetical protein